MARSMSRTTRPLSLAILDGCLGILSRPGVPFDHHAGQPLERLALTRTGNRASNDRPTRTRFFIYPRRIGVACVECERDWSGCVTFCHGRVRCRCPRPAVPEHGDLFLVESEA